MGKLNKILVLGDGLLGSEIIKQTNWDYISRKKDGLNVEEFNGENILTFVKKFIKYDIIINCIAHTNTYSKERYLHWKINYEFVYKLVNICNLNQIKLVHISTDYIYSNSINNASETDVPVHCNNWYGYTKLLSDGLVQLLSNDYLLCRCTHKPRPFPYDNAWVDQIGNFDYSDEISKLILILINKNANGVYNIGTDLKTMFELASQTKKVTESFSPDYVPKNQSINLDKLWKKIK